MLTQRATLAAGVTRKLAGLRIEGERPLVVAPVQRAEEAFAAT